MDNTGKKIETTLQGFLDSKPLSYWIRISDLAYKGNTSNDEDNELARFGSECYGVYENETGKHIIDLAEDQITTLSEVIMISLALYISVRKRHCETKEKFSFNNLDNHSFSLTELGKKYVENHMGQK